MVSASAAWSAVGTYTKRRVRHGVVWSALEVAEGVGAGVPVRKSRVVADAGEGAGGIGEVGASAARQPAEVADAVAVRQVGEAGALGVGGGGGGA